MNFSPGVLSPLQWGLLLAVPPAILLLYFLKLRREPLEVPSTYLWHRTVEDLHVNSIWQRLRQNLLLFLQLLLILLAILACLNPNWRSNQLADDRFIFLLDVSASMAASDIPDQPSRLDEAKRQIAATIDQMKSGDKAMIIPFSDIPGQVQSYTDNHRLLKRHLEKIEPTDRRSDLEQALRFAGGLANPGRSAYTEGDAAAAEAMPATLYILSDGRVGTQTEFSMGNLTPVYVPIGNPEAKNVGILAFQASRTLDKPDELQAFVNLKNFANESQKVQISLYLDDALVDATSLDLTALGQSGVEFPLKNVDSGVLRLSVDTKDDLAVDNQAFTILDITQRAKILLVTAGNTFLEFAFSTEQMQKYADVNKVEPAYLDGESFKKEAVQGAYDLVIFDQCTPATPELMPMSNTIFFNAIPPGDEWRLDGEQFDPAIIDIERSHPLMQFVEMSNIRTYHCRPVEGPKGSVILVDSDVGSMMTVASRDSFEDVVAGFELIGRSEDGGEFYNTEWPRSPYFPVFIQNALSYLGGVSEQTDSAVYQPGQMVQLRLDTTSKKLDVRTPDGKTLSVGRGRSGAFAFGGTDKVGVYELTDPAHAKQMHRVAVNLFDAVESNIPPVDELDLVYEKIKGTRGVERTRREAWRPLLMLALIVLLVEWYIYNRRVYL